MRIYHESFIMYVFIMAIKKNIKIDNITNREIRGILIDYILCK